MNNVVLIGRLTRDPELRYIPSGSAVCKFSLAVDKNLSKDKKEEMEAQGKYTADFINIVVWGKVAESCGTFLTKGLLVGVQGRIQSGSYEDNDGKTIYTTDVVANQVEFLEWKSDNERTNTNYQNNTNDYGVSGFNATSNDDIPF